MYNPQLNIGFTLGAMCDEFGQMYNMNPPYRVFSLPYKSSVPVYLSLQLYHHSQPLATCLFYIFIYLAFYSMQPFQIGFFHLVTCIFPSCLFYVLIAYFFLALMINIPMSICTTIVFYAFITQSILAFSKFGGQHIFQIICIITNFF